MQSEIDGEALAKTLELIDHLLPGALPPYVTVPLGTILLTTLILILLALATTALGHILAFWRSNILPLAYNSENHDRVRTLRIFSNHLLQEIRGRDIAENWRDDEFTELEAEVEVESPPPLPFWPRQGVRREKSLTAALRRSKQRYILLEGDPGSGKSVALRHLARHLLERAKRSRSLNDSIPIFVNLKELKRHTDTAVDRDLIRQFIMKTVNQINDRFVEEVIEKEFDRGLIEGRWIFLLDSFDEIPDILSSTEMDSTISNYTIAIEKFLQGGNTCRVVLSSRYYKGPRKGGWSSFRIMPLTQKRQFDLIRRALPFSRSEAKSTSVRIAGAPTDISLMTRNPMLLGLLCEHIKLKFDFPNSAFEVFGTYIDYRLSRDEGRIRTRFGISSETLKAESKIVAFAMTSDSRLGLSPARQKLADTLAEGPHPMSIVDMGRVLDALEYLKLGRGTPHAAENEREFTFSHRRFQEFFATSYVIDAPLSVPSDKLLFDARWRETAVVLLQNAPAEALAPLIECAREFVEKHLLFASVDTNRPQPPLHDGTALQWPERLRHALGILQFGLSGRSLDLDERLTSHIRYIVRSAFVYGDLVDKRFALEVAACTDEETIVALSSAALSLDSEWLNDAVYELAGRLAAVPDDIYRWMRVSLLRVSLNTPLIGNSISLEAYAARLPKTTNLEQEARLARAIPFVDVLGLWLSFLIAIAQSPFWHYALMPAIFLVPILHVAWKKSRHALAQSGAFGARMYTPLLFITLSSEGEGVSINARIAIFVSLLFASWGPAAKYAFETGNIKHVAQLPISHLAMVKSMLRVLIRPWRIYSIRSIVQAIVFLFIISASSYVALIYSEEIADFFTDNLRFLKIAGALVGAVLAVFVCVAGCIIAKIILVDITVASNFIKGPMGSINLLYSYNRAKLSITRVHILSKSLENGIQIKSHRHIARLRRAASKLSHPAKRRVLLRRSPLLFMFADSYYLDGERDLLLKLAMENITAGNGE